MGRLPRARLDLGLGGRGAPPHRRPAAAATVVGRGGPGPRGRGARRRKGALDRLADEAPAIVRDYFDEELLPAWAGAQLAPAGDARTLAEQAALVGDALWRRTGDALPRDAAVALHSSAAVAGRDPPRAQALGYRILAEARRRDETQRRGCESFREAYRLLSQGGSPYAAVAAERVVSTCLYPSQLGAARAELARLDSAAEPRAHILPLARARRLQGLIAMTRGDLTGALDRYRLARDGFVALGDAQNQAFVHALMAEALTLLGDGRRAWKERRSALALLDHVRDPPGTSRASWRMPLSPASMRGSRGRRSTCSRLSSSRA